MDAIEEFKLLGADYPAEFGRSLGSVLNVVFKSGSNRWHGSAYEFLRNSAVDANNWFDNRRGQGLLSFKRSQYGGVLNGPAIGFLARGIGLTGALGLVAVAGAVIALLGPRLRPQPAR